MTDYRQHQLNNSKDVQNTSPSGGKLLRRLLAIDTSTSTLSTAILDQLQLLATKSEHGERNHSTRLVPVIQDLLQSQGIRMEDLDGIAVGVGPGSYTGVRIGVTVAKTLAWSLKLPLIGVSSLAALALSAGTGEEAQTVGTEAGTGNINWLVPLMNARRKQAYTALFTQPTETFLNEEDTIHGRPSLISPLPRNFSSLERLKEDGIHLLEDWLKMLGELLANDRPDSISFIGDIEPFSEELERFANEYEVKVSFSAAQMSAACIGQLAQYKWMQGQVEEVHQFVPNYTQLAEAEVKLKARMEAEAKTGDCI